MSVLSNNKATRSPEISRQQVEKPTPPPISTRGLVSISLFSLPPPPPIKREETILANRNNIGNRKWFSDIQNGSQKKKFRIDLKWPEMPLKVNFGCILDIKNGRLIWNGQKCDRKWFTDIQNGRRRPFCPKFKKKFCIDLKWPEMRLKVIFRHPKWPPVAIL